MGEKERPVSTMDRVLPTLEQCKAAVCRICGAPAVWFSAKVEFGGVVTRWYCKKHKPKKGAHDDAKVRAG